MRKFLGTVRNILCSMNIHSYKQHIDNKVGVWDECTHCKKKRKFISRQALDDYMDQTYRDAVKKYGRSI